MCYLLLGIRDNLACGIGAFTGDNGQGAACESASVGLCTVMRDPALEVERQRPICQYPFPIVLAGNMDVRSRDMSALAGWIANWIACLYFTSNWHTAIRSKMEIIQSPTGAFIAVFVEIDDCPVNIRADDESICHGGGVLILRHGNASGCIRSGSKVNCRERFACAPTGVWSTGVSPDVPRLEWKAQLRLLQAPRQRGNGALPGVTKQVFISTRQAFGSNGTVESTSGIDPRKIVLQGNRGRVLPRIGTCNGFIEEFELCQITVPPVVIAIVERICRKDELEIYSFVKRSA